MRRGREGGKEERREGREAAAPLPRLLPAHPLLGDEPTPSPPPRERSGGRDAVGALVPSAQTERGGEGQRETRRHGDPVAPRTHHSLKRLEHHGLEESVRKLLTAAAVHLCFTSPFTSPKP